MTLPGKKGKKAKGKAVPLQDFLAATTGNGDTPSLSAVLNPPKSRFSNWADDQDDDSNMPMPLLQLPTAPRASRSFDDDSVPRNGPFLAYLSNLPYDLEEDGLEDFFSQLAVVSVRMPREDGGRSRGYGYVEFETREDLIDAISLPDPTINNRHIRIDVSTENDRRQRQGGGRYGDREPLSAGESNWRRGGPSASNNDEGRGGDRGGDRGSSRYSSQTTSRDTNSDWRVGERPAFDDAPPQRRGGGEDGGGFRERYGGRRSNYEERSSRDGPGPRRDASPPKERPKLQLQPRTLPVEPIVVTGGDDAKESERRSPSPPRPKPVPAANIFGAAKPVDTAAREREIEERLERERQEERRLREEARDKAKQEKEEQGAEEGGEEKEAREEEEDDNEEQAPKKKQQQQQEEGEKEKPAAKPAIISWRRTTEGEDNGAPHQSSFRRHTSPDGGGRGGPRREDNRDRRDDRDRGERGGGGGGYRGDDRRTGDYGRGGPRGGDRDRRMDRNER